MNATNHILLTFDIEDWFQVENFKPYIPFSSWPSCELRVEQNTYKLLDLLDQGSNQRSAVSNQRKNNNRQPTTDNGPENKTSFRQRRIGSDHFHQEKQKPKNLYPVKFFAKDSEANLTGAIKSGKSCLT